MDNQNNNPRQALIDKIGDCKNILVTVSTNPNVDQLAACLGLTIWLNKIGKHATAVFSGDVPSTLEFLRPAETLEKDTDSLRDFIISLDKSKADKLRWKVEDSVVKVFVTPYRTSLSVDDLEFSQGDFNVDMVIALGVHNREELDAAITAHGRILHDATVATLTIGDQASDVGSIGWHVQQASSLCELVTELANELGRESIDGQIATALLTGVVAQTERFSNDKTTPMVMSISAQLMSAGANQQLVASELTPPQPEPAPFQEAPADTTPVEPEQPSEEAPQQDGALEIGHEDESTEPTTEPVDQEPEAQPTEEKSDAISDVKELPADDAEDPTANIAHFLEPEQNPQTVLTANAEPENETAEPSIDPLSPTPLQPDQLYEQPEAAQPAPGTDFQPAPPAWTPPEPATVQDVPVDPVLNNDIDQPAAETNPQDTTTSTDVPDLNSARDEVFKAIDSAEPAAFEPVQALNAQPIDLQPEVAPEQPQPAEQPTFTPPPAAPAPVEQPAQSTVFDPAAFGITNDPELHPPVQPAVTADPNQPIDPTLTGPVEQPFTMPLPQSPLTPPPANPTPPTSVTFDPTAPPPVPPPMMPPKQ